MRVGASMLVGLLLAGCAYHGAPTYALFGAYFPSWLLCGVLGILAAVVAHRVFVATGLTRQIPLQLSVCSAIGTIVAVIVWLFGTGQF
jgi:hypothetical protein